MRTLRHLAVAALVVGAGLASPASALAGPGRERQPFEAACRTSVQGSRAIASCHNPYPDSDMVQLHIECARWWDPDVDMTPVEAGPAKTVELAGRCWMEIREAWVTHRHSGG